MSLISFAFAAVCFAVVLQGRRKPILQVLPMILVFLAWSAFGTIEFAIENDPSHPNIRIDLVFLIPLAVLSVLAFGVCLISRNEPEDTPSVPALQRAWRHRWTISVPPVVGVMTLSIIHWFLSWQLRIPIRAISITSARCLVYELLPYWALSLSVLGAPRKTRKTDLVAGLMGITACCIISLALALVSDLYRLFVYALTPLLAIMCCLLAVQLGRRNFKSRNGNILT